MNPGRKGAVELCHTFHTPLFLAHTHTWGGLILTVGGFWINARSKEKNKVGLNSSSTVIGNQGMGDALDVFLICRLSVARDTCNLLNSFLWATTTLHQHNPPLLNQRCLYKYWLWSVFPDSISYEDKGILQHFPFSSSLTHNFVSNIKPHADINFELRWPPVFPNVLDQGTLPVLHRNLFITLISDPT